MAKPTVFDEDPPENSRPQQPANRLKAGKRPPTRTSWKPGQSGNPAGRKPAGQSWAEIFKLLTDKTADEQRAEIGGSPSWLDYYLKEYPTGVPLKQLIALNVLIELMKHPSAGLLNALVNCELPAVPEAGPSPSEPGDAGPNGNEGASPAPPE